MARLKDFTLKSGAKLQVQPAEFEKGVALVEAVGKAILGKEEYLQFDQVRLVRRRCAQGRLCRVPMGDLRNLSDDIGSIQGSEDRG